MPRVSDVYGGAYLTGADLAGRTHRLQISQVAVEEIGDEQERKLVVSFAGAKKSLVLNKTNASALVSAFGDDTVDWHSTWVELFTMPVTFNGRTYDGIRVRKADATAPPAAATAPLMTPPAPTPAPVALGSAVAAMASDEIPF